MSRASVRILCYLPSQNGVPCSQHCQRYTIRIFVRRQSCECCSEKDLKQEQGVADEACADISDPICTFSLFRSLIETNVIRPNSLGLYSGCSAINAISFKVWWRVYTDQQLEELERCVSTGLVGIVRSRGSQRGHNRARCGSHKTFFRIHIVIAHVVNE